MQVLSWVYTVCILECLSYSLTQVLASLMQFLYDKYGDFPIARACLIIWAQHEQNGAKLSRMPILVNQKQTINKIIRIPCCWKGGTA